ncbi:two component transcriptional regulator, LuxR family [Clostridium cavendishii DSM 21758]|uniref:Stage 0 sporulation protein A homolog n=1 Tax=Clostridium cavendishii DSM 21758 TaxID=1121302 RepID=A0A1M6TXK2_9CLOT|nr:response regulator transcription factor [Clostridium cavendishii]SHK61775.1 two component transcriptional regulator, LuxR family [Clostridium cavendishii DSM 21758]
MKKILIVDDDILIREGLKVLIDLEEDFEVIATAKDGQEAIKLCEKLNPNIVLMDIRMPVMDGVIATGIIKKKYPDIKVVLLTTFKDDEYITEAIKCGAEGYILKSQSSDIIIESLRTVYKGNSVFEKEIVNKISFLMKNNKEKLKLEIKLTEREISIMKLVGEGLSNKEIAENLFLGEGTIRNYITILLTKFNLRDRTQLAIFYLKNFS